jgi:putative intracellular protease/amidase
MATILVPLPDRDFDTTEVAVPWRLLTDAGHTVVFATESGGAAPATDPLLLTGVMFKMLGASREAKRFYAELQKDERFQDPIAWADIDAGDYDGLLLPGGHAWGMRQYLDSAEVQAKVVEYWRTGKPVGAICHGVLVLARAVDPSTGRSVLHGRRTTCLPMSLEMSGFYFTVLRRGRYYRTSRKYVEREVRRALASRRDFRRGGPTFLVRGTSANDRTAFVLQDGNYVSARWPGDAYLFARRFAALLAEQASVTVTD